MDGRGGGGGGGEHTRKANSSSPVVLKSTDGQSREAYLQGARPQLQWLFTPPQQIPSIIFIQNSPDK